MNREISHYFLGNELPPESKVECKSWAAARDGSDILYLSREPQNHITELQFQHQVSALVLVTQSKP